jgi:hypothetical protein
MGKQPLLHSQTRIPKSNRQQKRRVSLLKLAAANFFIDLAQKLKYSHG